MQELANEATAVLQLPEVLAAAAFTRSVSRLAVLMDCALTLFMRHQVSFLLGLCPKRHLFVQNPLYAYNYVTWTGGANSYETCDLTDRAPQYVGTCSARTTCNSVSLLPAVLVAASSL